MEIRNNTSSGHAAFLQNKQVRSVERTAISTSETQRVEAPQTLNIGKTQQPPHSNHKNGIASYKVTAHEQQLAHQTEKAIASYNRVENSQYGQELVSRIELLV